MAEYWSEVLRRERESRGFSRRALASAAGMSAEAVRAYERGSRRPRSASLDAILDVLRLDGRVRNSIRESLGLAPNSNTATPPEVLRPLDLGRLQADVAELPWPSFVANSTVEVVVANSAAEKLWNVDLSREFLGPRERNLLGVATNPHFADRCLNWDEVVGTMISFWKDSPNAETLSDSTPYFKELLEDLTAGNPQYLNRFIELWDRTPPRGGITSRFIYNVSWQEEDVGEMSFIATFFMVSFPENAAWHDWIPASAEDWSKLEKLLSLR